MLPWPRLGPCFPKYIQVTAFFFFFFPLCILINGGALGESEVGCVMEAPRGRGSCLNRTSNWNYFEFVPLFFRTRIWFAFSVIFLFFFFFYTEWRHIQYHEPFSVQLCFSHSQLFFFLIRLSLNWFLLWVIFCVEPCLYFFCLIIFQCVSASYFVFWLDKTT